MDKVKIREWCGFELKTPSDYGLPYSEWWQYPDGSQYSVPPDLDMNFYTKYVMPKLQDMMTKIEYDGFIHRWTNNYWGLVPIKDPAEAFGEALEKLIDG